MTVEKPFFRTIANIQKREDLDVITVTMPQAQEQLPDLLLTAAAGGEIEVPAESGQTFLLNVRSIPSGVSIRNPDWQGFPIPEATSA